MPFEPTDQRRIGRTDRSVTRLGFGAAEIGGLYFPVTDEAAEAIVRHAWDLGVRYFDVAPVYGLGLAETRLGRVLREFPRDDFTLSTKVGRTTMATFDFSRDGVLRSIEASLGRLGLDRVDIVFIHDPDDHWEAAISEACPTLAELRAAGVIGAIGAGMDQAEMLARFVREAEIDVVLCAGRYTLLDQGALDALLPACVQRSVSVVIGGVMNSGLLADPNPASHFNYGAVPGEWLDRAMRLKVVCDRHAVPLRAAAIQFPLAHPAVASVAAGVRNPAHLDEYPAFMRGPIPADLWAELRAEGLLRDEAPTPV
jgi:Predicted oxidoreductases (related to aryl-alcohol dehydrogenases)